MEFEIPEDLTALTADELVALGQRIQDRQVELTGNDPATVDELEALADGWDRIDTELAGRDGAADTLADRAAAARARFANDDGTQPAPGEGDTPLADPTAGTEGGTPAAAAAAGDSAPANDQAHPAPERTGHAEPAPAPDAGAGAPDPALADENVPALANALVNGVPPHTNVQARLSTGTPITPDAVVSPAPARTRPRGSVLAAALERQISDHQALEVGTADTALQASFVAGPNALGKKEGQTLDLMGLAEAICRKRHSLTHVPEGISGDPITVATATMAFPDDMVMGEDMERSYGVLNGMQKELKALVASGGNCAPSAPMYDIFRTAQPHAPVENNLPVVGASRGGIRFVPQIDWTTARGGIGVTTNSEDISLGDSSGTGLKPCIHVDCPGTDEVIVTAISECVEFGNLSYRTFPEQTANMLLDLAVNFADVKEILYLNGFDVGSTAVTSTQVYGAVRSLVRTLLIAGTGYRLRNGMDVDAVLDWYCPVWAVQALKADLVADHALGLNFLNATIAQVTAELRAIANVNVIWTYAAPTSAPTQSFRGAQSSGALNAFPTTLVSFLHAPGVFFRLDAGTLDVGLIRDSALNRTNDLQLFNEQWVELAKPGAQAEKLTISGFLATGAGPTEASLLT